VIGASVDSKFTHKAWATRKGRRAVSKESNYPLLSDINKDDRAGIRRTDEDAGIALRGLFMINKDGILKQARSTTSTSGRNIEEVLRLLDAIDHTEKHGEVCPCQLETGERP